MSLRRGIATGILIALMATSSHWAYGAKRTAAKLPDDMRLDATPGKTVYKAKSGEYGEGQFAVFVPKAYAAETPIPLVVSSHGSGGNGPARSASGKGRRRSTAFS